MNIVAEFDPSITTSDMFAIPQSSANGKLVVWNESNISLKFSFQNGDSSYVPAWTAILYCPHYGNVNVTWQQHTQLAQNNPPLSLVVVEAYAQGEQIPGTFPMALAARGTNLGNTIPVGTGTQNVQDDGRVAGSLTVEATVSGDLTSALTLTNNAQFALGSAARPGSLAINGNGAALSCAGNITTPHNVNCFLVSFATGTISRVSHFVGTGAQNSVAHGLGANPDIILIQYAGNFGSPPSQPPFYWNTNSTTVNISAQNGYSWVAMALAF